MSEPILKAAVVSAVTRRVAGRPAPQPARKPSDATPYVPQPALAGAAPRPASDTACLARPDVDELRRDMEAFREAARKQAHEQGLAEGRAEGRAQGHLEAKAEAAARQAEQTQQLDALFQRLAQHFGGQIEGLESVAIDVVLTACRRILGESAATQAGVVAAVKTALAAAAQDEVLQVRVNPRDIALLKDTLGALPNDLPLRADETLAAGGCIVEIVGGSIDARLDTQFRLLAEALADAATDPAERGA